MAAHPALPAEIEPNLTWRRLPKKADRKDVPRMALRLVGALLRLHGIMISATLFAMRSHSNNRSTMWISAVSGRDTKSKLSRNENAIKR